MKFFIVDDNEKFRKGLRLFLESHESFSVVGEAANGKDFLNSPYENADIILMDINMPEVDGMEATKFGLWKNNHKKIIAVSQHKEGVDLVQLIGAGFRGFVSKSDVYEELIKAIQSVGEGHLYFPEDINCAVNKSI